MLLLIPVVGINHFEQRHHALGIRVVVENRSYYGAQLLHIDRTIAITVTHGKRFANLGFLRFGQTHCGWWRRQIDRQEAKQQKRRQHPPRPSSSIPTNLIDSRIVPPHPIRPATSMAATEDDVAILAALVDDEQHNEHSTCGSGSSSSSGREGGYEHEAFDSDTVELVALMMEQRRAAAAPPAGPPPDLWNGFEVAAEHAAVLVALAAAPSAVRLLPLPPDLRAEYWNDALHTLLPPRPAPAPSLSSLSSSSSSALAVGAAGEAGEAKRRKSKLKFRSRRRDATLPSSPSAGESPKVSRASNWSHQTGNDLALKLGIAIDDFVALTQASHASSSSASATTTTTTSAPISLSASQSADDDESPVHDDESTSTPTSSKTKRHKKSASGGGHKKRHSIAPEAPAMDRELLDAIAVLCATIPETPRRVCYWLAM
jgi:hypothetical protein